MDFALERLVTDPTCNVGGQARPTAGGVAQCEPDSGAFKQLVNQFGAAIAPTMLYPADTVGAAGFEVLVEGAYTTIDSGSDYMRRGTRGETASTGQAATENTDVPDVLQLYSLRIRKGFGFGLETGVQFGYLVNTSILAGGLDLRISLLEGFQRGGLGYLPDIAIGGGVRTTTGTAQMLMTVGSASAVISKPITIAKSGVLTPLLSYQYLWMWGDAGLIDFTPATSALEECGYQGPNQPGFPESSEDPERDGVPICTGDETDLENTATFEPARLERQRMALGATYRYEILTVGAQFSFDLVHAANSQAGDEGEDGALFEGTPNQYGFALQVGAVF